MKSASLAILVLVVGCASYARSMGVIVPGSGVTDELATMHCGSPEAFQERVDYFVRMMNASGARYIIPQIGTPACDVLAALGLPNEQVPAGTSERWMYQTGSMEMGNHQLHVLTLESADDGWTVTAVAW